MNAGDVITLLGAVAIIVLMLIGTWYATRWYAKRAGGSFAGGAGKYIKVIDRAQMGAASLVIVEIEAQYYLIGLSDKNMQLICRLDGFTPREPAAPATMSFGRLFGDMLKRRRQDGGENSGGDS